MPVISVSPAGMDGNFSRIFNSTNYAHSGGYADGVFSGQ